MTQVQGITRELRNTSVEDGWFKDDERNWAYGYGRGELGARAATEAFAMSLQRASKDGNFVVLGAYYEKHPVGYITVEYLGSRTRTVRIETFFADDRIDVIYGALERMLTYIFQTFGKKIHRVETELLRSNPSIEAFRLSGFRQEGIRRSAHWMGMNVFDVLPLRILRPDWVKLQKEN